jgi:hypothetical protein
MEEKLVQGSTYLVKYGSSGSISQITILMITDKAYQFKYESGNTAWVEKREFERDYNIIENISDFVVKEPQKNFDGTITFAESIATEYETCPVCHGTGIVPNAQTTAAFVTCPLCQGNRRVVKRTEVKV